MLLRIKTFCIRLRVYLFIYLLCLFIIFILIFENIHIIVSVRFLHVHNININSAIRERKCCAFLNFGKSYATSEKFSYNENKLLQFTI